ncbi:MAG TPA: response regulator [Burkholderiaceae bacterium]
MLSDLPRRRLAGARMLVVEDNVINQDLAVELLTDAGMVVTVAGDGREALALLERQEFDGVLMDCQMPVLDGYETTRAIRAQPHLRHLPVIALTTNVMAGDRERAFASGMNDHVPKPIDVDRLFEAIARWVRAPATAQAAARSDPGSDAGAPGYAGDPIAPTADDELRPRYERLAGARLLLAEDNTINQELIVELLGDAGVEVVVAVDGTEALARLAHERFDGVLMDCQMPGLDGYEAARRLRAMPSCRELPIIAMTASATAGDREKALAAGMNDHIAKPFDVPTMFETIARWVRPAAPATTPAALKTPSSPDALPGLDAGLGRANAGGSDKLYRRLLVKFRGGQANFAAQFRDARDRGDAAATVRIVHGLCAMSANLGAVEVERAAQALEEACTRDADAATVARLLDEVQARLRPLIAGLQALE